MSPRSPLLAGKEYSKADSRYATRDDFIISMEAVTAFIEGPVCLLIVWGMIKAKPWRYTAILLVSLGQFYGDVLYFGTCIHGGERGAGKRGRGAVAYGDVAALTTPLLLLCVR
jgi:hypothetical protein